MDGSLGFVLLCLLPMAFLHHVVWNFLYLRLQKSRFYRALVKVSSAWAEHGQTGKNAFVVSE